LLNEFDARIQEVALMAINHCQNDNTAFGASLKFTKAIIIFIIFYLHFSAYAKLKAGWGKNQAPVFGSS
jgi:hypothetical protein